jgi:hypothetical protein
MNLMLRGCALEICRASALPLTEEELTRRRKAELTPEQDKLLVDWGYPWVLDEFNFHFSLTGSLDSVDAKTEKN